MSPSTLLRRSPYDAPDPPGGIGRHLDARLARDVAELPLGAAAELLDVEVGREAEVALAARGEADLGADARDAEVLDDLVVEVLSDHVPGAVLGQQRVRIDRALALLVAADRPVVEADRALLRDRALELAEAALQLGRVVGVAHLDANRGRSRAVVEPSGRAAERQVLQREPQRLGVGEAPFEQVQARLQRRELVVVQLERGQEVALGSERVELLAGEFVALRVERHAEPHELRPVRVEAPGKRLVAHLLVALDVALDVARGQRPTLCHQEGDERELTDQLVGVVAHSARQTYTALRAYNPGEAMRRSSSDRGADATGNSPAPAAACADTACPCASWRGSARLRLRTARTRSAPR